MSPDASAPSGLDVTPLRFDVAHPNAPMKETTCSACSRQVRTEYYEVEGNVVCVECRSRLAASMQGSERPLFLRALGFGALASLVAAAGYGTFKTVTGYDVGLIAILVGYVVGRAVHVGGGKRGGRRYQILAVVLTYCAVSLSYIPDLKSSSDLMLLLALPVAAGLESIISIFLLVFALMQAWRMNRAVQVRITGPYRLAEPQGAELPST